LFCFTFFWHQVSAVDSVGEGAKTEPKNITFGIEGISSYVGDLEGTPVGNTSIKLTWGTPANDGEKIDSYVVHYQNLLGNMVTRIVDKKTLFYVGKYHNEEITWSIKDYL
jgi:hypothetical protein